MPITLNIIIDKGMMPRSGLLNKQFRILVDNEKIGETSWGEKRRFALPAGKHTLTLQYKRADFAYHLDFEAGEAETVTIRGTLDPKQGGFFLYNLADGTMAANTSADGSPVDLPTRLHKVRAANEEMLTGVCASVGAVVFVVLNFATHGVVPGGFLGGCIGGGLGAVVGMGINALRRKC